MFLAEYRSVVIQWLKSPAIHFDERDFKQYGDGSFRLYFRSPTSLKRQYRWLLQLTASKAAPAIGDRPLASCIPLFPSKRLTPSI